MLACLSNSGALCEKLEGIVRATTKMASSGVFLHHYAKHFGEGVEEELERMLLVV